MTDRTRMWAAPGVARSICPILQSHTTINNNTISIIKRWEYVYLY